MQMTSAINRIPYAPRLIQSLQLWNHSTPTDTDTPFIERQIGKRQIVPIVPYGVRLHTHDSPNREGSPMKTWPMNTSSSVKKTDTVGKRRFGEMTVETLSTLLSDRLEAMRQDTIESSMEYYRMQSLLGDVKNPDGSTVVNWYNFFNVTPTNMNYSTASNGSNVLAYCKTVKDAINDALQGIPCTGYVGILGDNAWNELFKSTEIKDSYKYRSTGDQTTAVAFTQEIPGSPNPNQTSINWGSMANIFTYGGISLMNYRASVDFPTSRAVFFPIGVRGMFDSVLSPSTITGVDQSKVESGTEFYAHTWEEPDGSEMGIFAETNRIEANLLPEACIQATFAA